MTKPQARRTAKTIDTQIGKRIREARLEKRYSQAALGEAVGVSFQQIQKYERAANRISANTLFAICQFLDCPIEAMFAPQLPFPGRKRSAKR